MRVKGDKLIRSIFTRESQNKVRAVFFVILAIVLMVVDKRYAGFAAVRDALTLPLSPLQYAVSWPLQLAESLKTMINTQDHLIQENLKLKSEQLLLRSQLQRLIAVESENTYLKSLLKSTKQIKSKTLIAEVLAIDTEPFIHQVVLDKGSKEGVYIGQAVLDANGVMGKVIQAGLLNSRVLLINDPRSGIPVQNVRTGLRAIATGDSYTGKMRLMYVPKTADIKVNDSFITSGLGKDFPEGYPVGQVLSVTKEPSSQFSVIILQPSARLNSSRQVLLVWYPKNA